MKEGYSLDDAYKIIVRYGVQTSSSNFDKDTYTIDISEYTVYLTIKNVDDGTVTIRSTTYIDNLDVSIIYTGWMQDASWPFSYMSYVDTQNKNASQSLPYICFNKATVYTYSSSLNGSAIRDYQISSEVLYIICNSYVDLEISTSSVDYLFELEFGKNIKFASMSGVEAFTVFMMHDSKSIFSSGCKLVFDEPSNITELLINGEAKDPNDTYGLDGVRTLRIEYSSGS